jgi:hypothetical protein
VILNKTDRRIEGAAERLGVKPTTPLSWMKKVGLKRAVAKSLCLL